MYVSAQKAGLRQSSIHAPPMNQDRLQGICKQLGGKLMECWGALNGDPLTAAAGRRERLTGRILEQRGIARQAADRQIEDFRNRHRHWLDISKR
jgi:uncharacterized protein YjbJ (UPF0337 family)